MKRTYVKTGKPLVFKKYEQSTQPIGWVRIDLLRKRLKEDKKYKSQFTQSELKQIKDYK